MKKQSLKCLGEFNTKLKSETFISYFKKNSDASKLHNILYTDIPTIEKSYVGSVVSILSALIFFVVSTIYIFRIDIFLSLVFMGFSIIPMISQPYFSKKIQKSGQVFSETSEEYMKDINENINGIYIIKHYLREKLFYKKNLKSLRKFEDANIKKELDVVVAQQVLLGIYSIAYTVPFLIGGYYSIKNNTDVSSLIAIYLAADRASGPIMSIIAYINRMKSSKAAYDKVSNIIEDYEDPTIEISYNKIDIDNIEFKDAQFGYNEPLYTFNGEIQKGDKVLLIGPSGSGKSTFIKTLFNEIDLLDGQILFDGEDHTNKDRGDLFYSIGYIPQESVIFDDTVEFNITLGENYSKEKIIETLKKSGFENYDFESFLKKNAGEKGQNLSGGERARINVARALIRDYDILFIDEFSASLDKEVAKDIRDILFDLDTTMIEISHHYEEDDVKRFDNVINIAELA